jgi:hypothetical protein
MHGTSQRFGESRVLKRHVIGNMQGVFGDDARRNADELGVGAIIEEQVVAKILLSAFAEIALTAGGGVERDDAVTRAKFSDASAGLNHGTGKLMSEESGGDDHARVVATAKNLQIGSAGKGRAHFDDYFSRRRLGHGHTFDTNIFASVKDCGLHRGPAVMDGGFDRGAAMNERTFDGRAAMVDRIFNRSAAVLNRGLDCGTPMLDRGLNRGAAALDYCFDRARHQAPPTLPLRPGPAQS